MPSSVGHPQACTAGQARQCHPFPEPQGWSVHSCADGEAMGGFSCGFHSILKSVCRSSSDFDGRHQLESQDKPLATHVARTQESGPSCWVDLLNACHCWLAQQCGSHSDLPRMSFHGCCRRRTHLGARCARPPATLLDLRPESRCATAGLSCSVILIAACHCWISQLVPLWNW